MSISGVSSLHNSYVMQKVMAQTSLANQQQQVAAASLDSDGDHDHGIPDGDKGRNIDIRA